MNLTDLPERTLRAAVLKALADKIKSAIEDGKDDLQEVMDTLRIDVLSADLPDGTEVAKVRRAGGNSAPKVTDEAKFTAWVQEHRPDEIVPVVRESYRRALLARITDAGKPVDPDSGEVVPGVDFCDGAAYLTVNFTKDGPGGAELIEQAWQSGGVNLNATLALPAPAAAGGDES